MANSNSKVERVTVKLKKSVIGCIPSHKATVRGLGLRKIHQSSTLDLTPCVQGMINKVSYLLEVEKV